MKLPRITRQARERLENALCMPACAGVLIAMGLGSLGGVVCVLAITAVLLVALDIYCRRTRA